MNGDLASTKEKVVRALDAAFNKRPVTNPPPDTST
jgi:hypothetical protein